MMIDEVNHQKEQSFEDLLITKYGEKEVGLARNDLKALQFDIIRAYMEKNPKTWYHPAVPCPPSRQVFLDFTKRVYIEYIKRASYIDNKVGMCLFELVQDWSSLTYSNLSKHGEPDTRMIEEYLILRSGQPGDMAVKVEVEK